MHAIIDTERKERNGKVEKIKRTQEIGLQGAQTDLRDARHVGTLTSLDHQHGTAMTIDQFMTKLRKINPDLVCLPHPHQPGFCNIYLELPDGTREHLMPLEDWMPEWSVMSERETRAPLAGFSGAWAPAVSLGREQKRGWRTVLARLVQKGLIHLDAVERLFGAGNRRSWAALTGKTTQAPVL